MKSHFLIVGLLLLPSQLAFSESNRPNILLILSDDHSFPHVGAYGANECERLGLTSNTDALAREGMRFDRAYTAAPQCAPSRTAIFAGRSPVGLAATRFAHPARANVPFFTDVLRDSGYWVGLDGRHQHLDGKLRDLPAVSDTLVELGMRGPRFERRFDHFVQSNPTKGKALSQVGETVSAVLKSLPEGRPWFLYFGLTQPHRPWGDDHDGIDPASLVLPPDWPDLPEVRLDYARYLAEVRDMDTGVGLIMKALNDHGADENTMVIFMGDNGEALLRGKGTLSTRGTHVPLLIRWPKTVKPGSVSDALISGVDLAPTILAAAGLEKAEGMTGMSFLPLLEGRAFESRECIFAERGWHAGPIVRTDGFDLSRSVTTRQYHFIYNAIPERQFGPVDMTQRNVAWEAIKTAYANGELSDLHERLYFRTPRPIFELYDLTADPHQLTNLAGNEQTMKFEKELRSRLDRWMVLESDYLPLPSHAHMKAIK